MSDLKETEQIFSDALDYFEQKNYVKAVYLFMKAAEQGHSKAMYNLGICYYDGHGVNQDQAESARWYEKAAMLGHAMAQFNIAMCYIHGRGVNQNEAKAVEWLLKSAEQGEVPAICNLGNCYYHGIGVEQDYHKAIEYFHQAADLGDVFAQYNMGNAYIHGKGVPKDTEKAKEWLRKSLAGGNGEAQKLLDQIEGNASKYKTTFNYLFSHKALPMSIFHDLDLFYQSIITSPQSLQVYLQNVLLTAKAWAQKYSPDCEPGYDVERFKMAILGDKPENSVVAINIPNCVELNDCVDIAIPFLRDHAGYFTCELSENPIDGSMMFMVGEWRPDGEGLRHINYGPLGTDDKETFISKVIKRAYGLDYTPPTENVGDGHDRPASTSDNTEYYQKYSVIIVKGWEAYIAKDYDTALKLLNEAIKDIDIYALFFQIRSQIHKALGNDFLADYDMFRAKLIDYSDTGNGKELDAEIVKTMRFEPREPLIQTENYYDILQNKDGDLLFCVRTRQGEPHMSELYYSGGSNALFCRRLGQYILLEEIHETIRKEIYNSDRVLFAEFVPSEEKRDIKKDSGVIREYYVHVRFLPPAISLNTIADVVGGGYPLFAHLGTLVRQQVNEGKTIADATPLGELPSIFAIHAREQDYTFLDKYIAEKLPINERCSKHFMKWQPTPLFFITTLSIWNAIRDPEKMLKYLVEHGADPNMPSGEGDTPLGNQCFLGGKSKIMRTLLKVGADPNRDTVSQGVTCKPLNLLLYTAGVSHEDQTFHPLVEDAIDRTKLLINAGADVNAINDSFCPLSLALLNSKGSYRKELVQLLLSKGANVDTAIKCMLDLGETYPENYYSLYELYTGLHDLAGPLSELAKWYNPETALHYLQLSADKGYAPAKRLLAEYTQPPDCAD